MPHCLDVEMCHAVSSVFVFFAGRPNNLIYSCKSCISILLAPVIARFNKDCFPRHCFKRFCERLHKKIRGQAVPDSKLPAADLPCLCRMTPPKRYALFSNCHHDTMAACYVTLFRVNSWTLFNLGDDPVMIYFFPRRAASDSIMVWCTC